jgi:hypothetical protein
MTASLHEHSLLLRIIHQITLTELLLDVQKLCPSPTVLRTRAPVTSLRRDLY